LELELSVARLNLPKVQGGNSPQNELADDEDDTSTDGGHDDSGERRRNLENKLNAEDLDVLAKAAHILRSQLKHMDDEIKANIYQRKSTLFCFESHGTRLVA
jgi:hypothetical protein